MGYKLNTFWSSKTFKKTGSSVKSRSANRNHILTKQSTKEKDIIEDLMAIRKVARWLQTC